MTPTSRAELAAAPIDAWRDWLRDGCLAFGRAKDDEHRVSAFVPLVVDPVEYRTGADLVFQIKTLVGDKLSVPARACASVLEAWSLKLDGAKGGAFLLQVAAGLGAPGLAASTLRLLRQAADIPREAADWLAWVAVRAARERFTPGETIRLGAAIGKVGPWPPHLLAEFATVLAADNLRSLPPALLSAAPEMLNEPHTGELVRAVAERLELDHDRESLRDALTAEPGEDEDVWRFRRVLARELRVDAPQSAPPLQRGQKQLVDRELNERLPTQPAEDGEEPPWDAAFTKVEVERRRLMETPGSETRH